MMSKPLHVDTYENNDVRLDIQEFETHRVIWIQCGVAAISFDEQQVHDLYELIDAYVSGGSKVSQTLKIVSSFILGLILAMFIAPLLF